MALSSDAQYQPLMHLIHNIS